MPDNSLCSPGGAPAPSSLGGTETHDHGHPGPPLLVLVDARPHGPQTVQGHPKAQRSPRGHGKTASPAGLEAQVRPPRCGAALSGAVPTLGGPVGAATGGSQSWAAGGQQGVGPPSGGGGSPPQGAGRSGAKGQGQEELGQFWTAGTGP